MVSYTKIVQISKFGIGTDIDVERSMLEGSKNLDPSKFFRPLEASSRRLVNSKTSSRHLIFFILGERGLMRHLIQTQILVCRRLVQF